MLIGESLISANSGHMLTQLFPRGVGHRVLGTLGALISFGNVRLLALSDALAMHPNLRDWLWAEVRDRM
jgi:hypothetical protein